ncbi:hypothetical protein P7C73_g6578, partial [Tremellales sp. Uapishka_1]
MVWSIDLSGKSIIVTGGNRGIGLGISRQCAEAGANVAIIYRSSPTAVDVAKEIAEKYNVKCVAYQCDVGESKAVHALVRKVHTELGPVGGIVCNAGIVIVKPALEITKEDFDSQINTNLWGVFNCAQAAAALWKEIGYKDGRVVFISSAAGTIATKGVPMCFYNSSKSALTMLAKSLAVEWADEGVLVNILAPGFVSTEINDAIFNTPEEKAALVAGVPLNRWSDVDEQAGVVVFMLSKYASFCTGAQLIVDGGESVW